MLNCEPSHRETITQKVLSKNMLFKKSLALIYYLLNSDENEKFSFKVKDANKGKSKEDFVPQWENITKEIIEKKNYWENLYL